jgi:hypothetical protein
MAPETSGKETSGKLFLALMIPKLASLRFIKQREKLNIREKKHVLLQPPFRRTDELHHEPPAC